VAALADIKSVGDLVRIARENPTTSKDILALVDRLLNGESSEPCRPLFPPTLDEVAAAIPTPSTNGHAGNGDIVGAKRDLRCARRRQNHYEDWHTRDDTHYKSESESHRVDVEECQKRLEERQREYWTKEGYGGTKRGRQPVHTVIQAPLDRERRLWVTYTQEQAAVQFQRSSFTVGRWCRNGTINATRVPAPGGGVPRWVITQEEINRIANEGFLPVDLTRNV
jgi:hypothetical protein